jgi:hypothetical protein
MVGVRDEYRRVCRDRRIELFEDFVQDMSKKHNYALFQKRVSAMKARDSRSTCQLDPSKLDTYAAYFDSTFGSRPKGSNVRNAAMALDPSFHPVDFSDKQVAKILSKYLLNGKAAGPDQLSAELIKHEMDLSSQLLSMLFDACFRYAVSPKAWCRANVVPIYKNKGDIQDIANYRPISLTSVVRRGYERMLLSYMAPFTESFLQPSQGGFRVGRGTLQQCYALHEIMQSHPQSVHVFLDIKAAYDCVNRNILWDQMAKYGFPAHMILVCRSLFDKNVANLVVNGRSSRDIGCDRGLLQGSSLSPLLFNVYIDPLLVRLERMPKMITYGVDSNNLFFADDGALHAKDAEAAQALLDVCSSWGLENGLDFAPGKCAVLCKDPPPGGLRIQGGLIPVANSFVYLGVECVVGKGMVFAEKHEQRIAKMVNTAKYLKSKGMNALGWRVNTSVLAYKSFIRPIMEYGLSFMPASRCKMLGLMNSAQNAVLNMVLSTARSTSRGAKLKLLQVESMGARREKLQFLFFNALDIRPMSDSVCSRLWFAIKAHPGRKSKMFLAASENPIFAFAQSHDSDSIESYVLRRRFESMQEYDSEKDGMRDVAASIDTPTVKGPTAYTDPRFDKSDQHVLTMLRAGALTFHQSCKQCGQPVSRAHAWQCTGAEQTLRNEFGRELTAYQRFPQKDSILFPDFLLNRMDRTLAANNHRYGDTLFKALSSAAKVIRDRVSGYVLTSDGRSYYHPDRIRKASHYIRRGPSANELARRQLVNQYRNRKPGRPTNWKPP